MKQGKTSIIMGSLPPFEIEWEASDDAPWTPAPATYINDFTTKWTPRHGQKQIAGVLRSATLWRMAVYLEAPTGSGKSTIADMLGELRYGDRVTVLTSDHALQQQYTQIGFESLTGRSNWPCSMDITKTAANAPCTTGKVSLLSCEFAQKGLCAYVLQRNKFLTAERGVTNYHWWFLATQGREVSTLNRLLICDEAHTAEAIAREVQTVQLREFWPHATTKQLEQELGTLADVLRRTIQDLVIRMEDEENPDLIQVVHQEATSYLARVHRAQTLITRPYHYSWNRNGSTITPLVGRLKPLGDFRIMMSATIVAPELVEDGPWILFRMPSTFPKDRRPVVPLNTVKVGNQTSEEEYEKLVAAIDARIVEHSDTKGVVHTVSYELAEKIAQMSKYRSMIITHGAGGRDEAIAKFKAAPKGRVLVSPACMLGVDLPYDECGWQAIAKIPFANRGDAFLRARETHNPTLNIADTVRLVVQATGRGMRAPDDRCITYIMDSNWQWFYPRYAQMFPQWFREAIVAPDKISWKTLDNPVTQ